MDRVRPASVALAVASAVSAAGDVARGGQVPVHEVVRTTARIVRAANIDAALRQCRGGGPRDWNARTIVVERQNGARRSLTFRSVDGRFVDACDSIGVPIEGRRWCAPSSGRLFGGRLRDPRLMLCQARGRRPIAFAWITPRPRARWIGVVQGRRTELYRVAAGLPIRVSSDRDIHVNGSSATFVLRHYSAKGKVLARETLVARVAG